MPQTGLEAARMLHLRHFVSELSGLSENGCFGRSAHTARGPASQTQTGGQAARTRTASEKTARPAERAGRG